jgi:hypothetical protein
MSGTCTGRCCGQSLLVEGESPLALLSKWQREVGYDLQDKEVLEGSESRARRIVVERHVLYLKIWGRVSSVEVLCPFKLSLTVVRSTVFDFVLKFFLSFSLQKQKYELEFSLWRESYRFPKDWQEIPGRQSCDSRFIKVRKTLAKEAPVIWHVIIAPCSQRPSSRRQWCFQSPGMLPRGSKADINNFISSHQMAGIMWTLAPATS